MYINRVVCIYIIIRRYMKGGQTNVNTAYIKKAEFHVTFTVFL